MGCRLACPADLLGESPPNGLSLLHRLYSRPQLLALLETFVAQGEDETGPTHPLDSRPTRDF
jgi:hypothetical protein